MKPILPSVLAVAVAALVPAAAHADSLLLIPDTAADKVWAFSAYDGSLVSNAFIPNDGRQKQVMQVVQTPRGTILTADVGNDQGCTADDAIREYSLCGQYIRTLAGPSDGVCNPESLVVAYGKVWFTRLYDSTQETTPGANAIWSMNYDGTGLVQACASGSFGKIWALLPFNGGFIVSDSADNNLEFAPLSCATSAPFFSYGSGGTNMKQPQQMATLPDGSVVCTFFSASQGSIPGLYFFNAAGEFRESTATPACRGVYPLGNGEILCSGGTQVLAYNPATYQYRTIVNQVSPLASFRWIAPVTTCPADLNCDGRVDGSDLGTMLGGWGQPGLTDLNHDGKTDGADLGILLSAWGYCTP
jgi:hypothetical protein